MMVNKSTTVEFYTSPSGAVSLQVLSDSETVWLNRQEMATLFGRDVKTVGKHIANARREKLADDTSVVAIFATTAADGKTYQVEHYGLDVVLSVGYRVKSSEMVKESGSPPSRCCSLSLVAQSCS